MAAIPPGTGTVFNPAQQAIDSFRLQIDEHERLRHAHERLRHEHEHAVRRASESEQALSEAALSEARSKELARSLQATVEKYVATCSLRASVDESTSQGAQRPPPPSSPNTLLERRVRELEQQLETKSAELGACRTHVGQLTKAQAQAAELHEQLDEERVARRRAEQVARDHEANAAEFEKVLKTLRDALGRSEVDRQRREAEFQKELGHAAKKLRAQKSLADQLQRTLQQERHEQMSRNQQVQLGSDTARSCTFRPALAPPPPPLQRAAPRAAADALQVPPLFGRPY